MSNPLEFILKLTDQFTPKLGEAGRIADTVANKISVEFNKIEKSGSKLNASISELQDRLAAVNKTRSTTLIAREFDVATMAANRLEKQIERLEGKGKRSGGSGMLGGLLAGFGAYSIGQQAFSQQANAENQQIAFKVLTRSKKSGDELYGNVVKMADSTPFESQDLARSGKTLLGYGMDKSKIMPTLGMLGDIASAADNPADSLQSLALAFGQVQAKGHLAGQESLQLINAGFNPLKEISDITGLSMDKLNKAQEKGAITADMVTLAFKHATGPGGMFHDMMKEQSQTIGGKWSTFMDGVHHKLRDLGALLEPIAKVVMDFGSALLDTGPGLALVAGGIGVIAIATGGWSAAQGVLNFVMNMNPIVRIISLILIVGGVIWTLVSKYDGWGKSMRALWEIIKSFVSLNILAWKSLGETIWYYVQYGWLKFKSFIEWTAMALGNLSNAFKLLGQGEFVAAKDALFKEIITPSSKAIDDLQAKHKQSQAEFVKTGASSVQSIIDNYKKIGIQKTVGKTTDATQENGADYKNGFAGLGSLGEGPNGGKSRADGINSGGQRSIVININKMIERQDFHVMSADEASNEFEAAIREGVRRVLYSLNGVATN